MTSLISLEAFSLRASTKAEVSRLLMKIAVILSADAFCCLAILAIISESSLAVPLFCESKVYSLNSASTSLLFLPPASPISPNNCLGLSELKKRSTNSS